MAWDGVRLNTHIPESSWHQKYILSIIIGISLCMRQARGGDETSQCRLSLAGRKHKMIPVIIYLMLSHFFNSWAEFHSVYPDRLPSLTAPPVHFSWIYLHPIVQVNHKGPRVNLHIASYDYIHNIPTVDHIMGLGYREAQWWLAVCKFIFFLTSMNIDFK